MAFPVLLVVGYVVGLPALVWAWRDLARFPPPVWYWSGHRREYWRAGLVAAYVAGGWPAIAVALAWWRSRIRSELRDEAHFQRESHQHHHHHHHHGEKPA